MASTPIRILMIDDDREDFLIVASHLNDSDQFEIDWFSSAESGYMTLLENNHNLALIDYDIAPDNGLDLIVSARKAGCNMPIILLTGNTDDQLQLQPLESGADDYIPKQELTKAFLMRGIRHSIARKSAQLELKKSEERYRELAEYSNAILHNVGNVLTSITTSAQQLQKNCLESKTVSFQKLSSLLIQHMDDLSNFVDNHPSGRVLPAYLPKISAYMHQEHQSNLREVKELLSRLNLVHEIIETQRTTIVSSGGQEHLYLQDAVTEAIQVRQASLQRYHIVVETNFREPVCIIAPRTNLIHVLINLIKNAVEAMRDSKKDKHRLLVEVGSNDVGDAYLNIADTGSGIAPEHLDKIFKSGFTTKLSGSGTGLGYCAKTIHQMDGSITAVNRPNRGGALFQISFDKSRIQLNPDQVGPLSAAVPPTLPLSDDYARQD